MIYTGARAQAGWSSDDTRSFALLRIPHHRTSRPRPQRLAGPRRCGSAHFLRHPSSAAKSCAAPVRRGRKRGRKMRELTAHFAHRVPAICGINNTRTAKRILQNRQSCGLRILQISRWLKILHNLSRRLLHHIADDCEARLASRDGRSAAENLIRQHLRVLGVCDFGVLPAHKVVDLSCGHGVPGGRDTQPKSHGYHTRESAPGSRTGARCASGRAGGRRKGETQVAPSRSGILPAGWFLPTQRPRVSSSLDAAGAGGRVAPRAH